ncbi:MAG TPA: hypothetical protein VK897_10440 [Anaerolineales bacterium]|nr:hypothetical protein [Anaerolineales bacterium]
MATVKPKPLMIYMLWVAVTTIGWLFGIFNLDSDVKTYMDVIRLLPLYLADGLLIGLAVGVGQALVLRTFTDSTSGWVRATVLGYGLAFLGGIVVSVLIPTIVWLSQGDYLLPVREPSSTTMILNRHDIFWGGFLIGSIQWPLLSKIIPNPNRSKAVLWMLTNWFVLGISIFVSAFTHMTMLEKFQMGLVGTVMGIVTGWVPLAFLWKPDPAKQF